MRIQKCYFCSGPVYPGHGTMFIRNDCKNFRFCRPKCHKHFKAKHNPRKLAWTKAYRKLHNKQIVKDNILQFQTIRNEPEQYNRQVYVQTIKAMQKISDIRKKRQDRFWNNRMKLRKVKRVKDIQDQLRLHSTLISNPQLREKFEQEHAKIKYLVKQQQVKKGTMVIQEE